MTSQQQEFLNNPDLAFVTRQNWFSIWKNYFWPTSTRIATLSILLSIEIVCVLFSEYVMGIVRIQVFLVLELNLWVFAVAAVATNFFWSSILTLSSIWLRFAFGLSEPIGLLSLTFVDFGSIVALSLVLFIIKRIYFVSNKYEKYSNHEFKWIVIACLAAIVVGSLLAGITNYTFILKLYGTPKESIKGFTVITFGFTILKLTVNFIIFLIVYGRVKTILKNSRI
ncbi:ECF transporter S component [Mycoplasma sp. HU2014]|uniref:ECF transporter S component n=1 Tax=Mycoplasma sp. HU2014 TaxID=1664275 RepID=UPI00067B468A|nr:ECF transporter S component [Mycoplasma sp. HU2014]KNG79436.1 membrane protein [Mycoplasma sp. HU2014]